MRSVTLTRGVVHVWKAWVGGRPDPRRMRAELSEDELARARGFALDADRNRFVTARLALRSLLAAYLELPVSAIYLDYNRFGKPEIAGPGRERGLTFNLSHCEELALVAVTLQDRVGVDIERMREMEDLDRIAEMCFSAGELEGFRAASRQERAEAFFRCWTRKESLVKAAGDGLSYPSLREIDVAIGAARGWSTLDLDLTPLEGYLAAVTVETTGAVVDMRGWWSDGP